MKNPLKKYMSHYSEEGLWTKLQRYTKEAGMKVVYSALLLFYAYKRKDTPAWAKRVVIGALGYFISPIDVIPDLTPFLGYTDDIGILSFGLVTIAAYVNEEVRDNARGKLGKWFKDVDEEQLKEVDEKL